MCSVIILTVDYTGRKSMSNYYIPEALYVVIAYVRSSNISHVKIYLKIWN